MSLLALKPRDGNVIVHAGDDVKPCNSEVDCTSRRYPDWLLEQRRERCFTKHDFIVSRELGRGKFGSVFRAKETSTGRIVVLKVVKKEEVLGEGLYRQLQREVETHCRLHHPNIIRLYSYFHDEERCYLVLEMAGGGNLWQMLQQCPNKRLDEMRAASYVRQLCCALAYIHKRAVIHRDLKPENILISLDRDGNETVKLADFGWSVAQRANSQRTTFCGTPEYLPPEVCKAVKDEYGEPFDMYCVGVLLYEMLAGRPPFVHDGAKDHDFTHLMSRILRGRPTFPSFITAQAVTLIKALMSVDPSLRPTAIDILSNEWVLALAGPSDDAAWDT